MLTQHLIVDDAGFDGLRAPWEALHRAVGGTVFQGYTWQREWWRIFRTRFDLRILTAWDGPDCVGIVPMFRQTAAVGRLRLRRLTPLGECEIAGEYAALVAPARQSDVCASTAAYLRWALPGDADFLYIHHYAEDARFEQDLLHALARDGFRVWKRPRVYAYFVGVLPDTWPAFLQTLRPSARADLRRHGTRLRHEGAEFETVGDAGGLAAALDDVVALHAARWRGTPCRGRFVERPTLAPFLRAVIPELAATGSMKISFLKHAGQRVAAELIFENGPWFCFYLCGRNPAHVLNRHGPGKMIMAASLEAAIARGCRTVDFMGGEAAQKVRFGGREQWYGRALAVPRKAASWKGQAAVSLLRILFGAERLPALQTVLRRLRRKVGGADIRE